MMQFSAAPWRILDEEHHTAVKKAVATRQQYLPDILAAIANGAATGMPVVKPLEFNYPNQGYTFIKDQFLLGDSIIVAPMLTEGKKRDVVFPPGKWEYNKKIFKGPVVKSITVKLDELPVFKLVD